MTGAEWWAKNRAEIERRAAVRKVERKAATPEELAAAAEAHRAAAAYIVGKSLGERGLP